MNGRSQSRLLAVVTCLILAGCTGAAEVPSEVEVSLNSTTPILGTGPVTVWVFLPESVRACPSGVAVGMLAFGQRDVFAPMAEDTFDDVLAAGTFLLTRFPGEGLADSSAQFYPPNGTGSVVVYVEQGRVADPVIYTVANATWHERAVGGWKAMPFQAATLRAPCAVEVE